MTDVFTCHSRGSTGEINNSNDGCARWLTGTFQWNRAIVNVIKNTCPSPAMTRKDVCCETGRLVWPNRSCSTHCYDTWITYCISSQSIFYADRKGLWRILLAWILKSYSGRSIGFVFWVFKFCAIFKLPEDNYMWLWGFSSYVSWGKKKCPHLILSQISSHKRVFVRLSGTESVRWAIPLVNSISLLDV